MDTPLGATAFGVAIVLVLFVSAAVHLVKRAWWTETVQALVLRITGHSRLVPVRGGNRVSPRTPRPSSQEPPRQVGPKTPVPTGGPSPVGTGHDTP